MTTLQTLAGAAMAALALAAAAPLAAQEVGENPPVEITNTGNETRKVCFHKPKQVTLFAIGCITLDAGETMYWDRKSEFTPFKVKIYQKRKVLDKYLYARDLPGDTGKVIIGTGGRFGFATFKNINPKFNVRVCNTEYDDDIWFVLGYDMGRYGLMSQGWWGVKKGQCTTIAITSNLGKYWGLNSSAIPRVYYYARTYGDNPKFWSDGQRAIEFCMNKGKRFQARLGTDGKCGGDQQKESFRFLDAPTKNSSELIPLTF